MAEKRPNVVVFITHDTGRHLSPYGIDSVQSPHSQKLADTGVLFSQAFCTSPLCSPSRATCVTGRYPHQNGVMGLSGRPPGRFDMYETEKHAAQIFSEAGYESVLCGFEHETCDATQVGFEKLMCGVGHGNNGGGDLRTYGKHIGAWLDTRDKTQPFYLQIGCHETHQAWTKDGVESDTSLGLWMPPYLEDVPDLRQDMAEFQGAVKRLDDGLGEILQALDGAGVSEDTIFVYTTDHGIDVPRAKGTCFDPGLEVFLMMRYPNGGWRAGLDIDDMVSQIDLLPTLLEACDIAVPDCIEGQSLLPLLLGASESARTHIFAEKTYHDTYDPMRCVRTKQYKYIRYLEVNIFEDLRLATMTRRHYWKNAWRRTNMEEALYDLEKDPLEMNNVADDPAYTKVKDDLKRTLVTWMRDTQDPLLDGPVPSPYYQASLEELKTFL